MAHSRVSRSRTLRAMCSLALLAGLAAAAAAGAEPRVLVPGSRVSLEPPPMLALSPELPGFLWDEMAASIAINQFQQPFEQAAGALSREAIQSQGLEWIDSTAAEVSHHNAVLGRSRQLAAGIWFEKWLLLFGDEHEAVLVAATFPEVLSREPPR